MTRPAFLSAAALGAVVFSWLFVAPALAAGAPCGRTACPEVGTAPSALTAAYVAQTDGGGWGASNVVPAEQPYTYRLTKPCTISDQTNGACGPADFRECPAPPDRVVEDYVVEQRRLVLSGDRTVDGFPTGGSPSGTAVGDWDPLVRACVDVTALNPPPSPGEVFRYFRTLPLPDLPTHQQPPGNALAGLPVVFYTDGPTTRTFTIDIRGFIVEIVATASAFTWDTGDGTVLRTTDPGAPYPDHTIGHDYRSGTYTAALTTTWSATFSVDGGATADVPGTTTTEGPPVTFTVLQARPVLTDPFD
jgi:hypothetical protein